MAIKISPYPTRRRFGSRKECMKFLRSNYALNIECIIDSAPINGKKKFWPIITDNGRYDPQKFFEDGIEVDTSIETR